MLSPVHRLWRLLPAAARRRALIEVTAAIAPSPARPAPGPAGPLTVAGYFQASSGLAEGARRLSDMLEAAGRTVHRADLSYALRQGTDTKPCKIEVPHGPGVLILHVNGDLLPWAMAAIGRQAISKKHLIGFWNWELPVLPNGWLPGLRFVHRVWAPSDFVAEAVRARTHLPVQIVPYHVPAPSPAPLGREAFNLPADAFIMMSVFDASSSVERKNPLGAVRAHKAAFGDRPDRILVLKTYRTRDGGAAWRAVAAEASGAANIRIIDALMTREEVWALIRCADALISLHRAEGVGLALAEAMRLGVPVIATGWSGNLDFMDTSCALLIESKMTAAKDEAGVYSVPGAVWAEPDTAAAAEAMRFLADHPGRARELAANGAARVAALTAEACGRHALAMLQDDQLGLAQQ